MTAMTIQESAYAILALNEVDRAAYIDNLTAAENYMISVQLGQAVGRNYDYEGARRKQ